MSSSDLNTATLAAAAAALHAGDVSSLELTEHLLERIATLNPRLKALSDITADTARREAGKADRQRARGRMPSPLCGIPIAIKDLIDTTPAVCSAGLPFLADYRPKKDANVVQRLRRAGAVIVGVSLSDPGAFGVRTVDVTHPQDPSRTVGGSSGGSGAALAAGLAYAALGTDTGGSIRVPAACCAVAGFKPTRGRVSLEGIRPLVWSLDHVGPMARSVGDLGRVQEVLDPRYETTGGTPGAGPVRIGCAPGYSSDGDERVLAGLHTALSACRELGAEIVEVELPRAEETINLHALIFCAEARAYHAATFAEEWDNYPPLVRQFLDFALEHTGADYVTAMRRRAEITAEVEALFKTVDFLLLPTLPVLAPERDAETITLAGNEHEFTLAMVRYTHLFDHTGHPVVAMPVDVVGPGLAVSAQIVGPLRRDRDTIEFAEKLERMLGLEIDYTTVV